MCMYVGNSYFCKFPIFAYHVKYHYYYCTFLFANHAACSVMKEINSFEHTEFVCFMQNYIAEFKNLFRNTFVNLKFYHWSVVLYNYRIKSCNQ